MQIWHQGLNPRQKEAAESTEGPLLIVAGAGAGKTKTLTHRIANLIQKNTPPEAILAITFTNKAAKEMRERVFRMLEKTSILDQPSWVRRRGLPLIGTFHALGVTILREKGGVIGIPQNFQILDRDDALALVKSALKNQGIDPKQFEPQRMLSLISRFKSSVASEGGGFDKITHNKMLASTLERVYKQYQHALHESHALDFDDLLLRTVELLQLHGDVRLFYQQTWRYVHVDEYQDTNDVQYRLVRLLVGPNNNICVVGDSDQNIYSWRGASIANILRFEEDFPGAKVVLLEQNYRSTKTILSAANEVIAKNSMRKAKHLFTENEDGEQVSLYEGYDESDEARFIAEKISRLITRGINPKDIALLYRTNFQSRALEEALLYAGIPYQVLGTRFFERKEIKDVLAYLRAAMNPNSLIDIIRIINTPTRGIGKVTVEKVLAGKKNELPSSTQKKVADFYQLLARLHTQILSGPASKTVAWALKETGIMTFYSRVEDDEKERSLNIQELASLATRYDTLTGEEGITQLLADAALQSEQDQLREGADAVRLMTVHAAKGLEFHYVFVTGLEQDLFPSRRSQDESRDISEREEERRLFYVALTRAAKKVYLTYASFRTIFGNRQVNIPSEFLSDIPDHLMQLEDRSDLYDDAGGNDSIVYIE